MTPSRINPNSKINNFSFVYKGLFAYRLIMNFLYFGKYKQRFKKVIACLDPKQDKKILELCFGDIYIAQWCKENSIEYTGYDINPRFISVAKMHGYSVELVDIRSIKFLPHSDVTIIMGSLYHFHDVLDELITMVMASSPKLIISEPIKNYSSRNDVLGVIARNSANAGRGEESFRFTEETLLAAIEKISDGRFNISKSICGKDAVLDIRRK